MLSALIPSIHSYPASVGTTTGTPEVCPSRSSLIKDSSSQFPPTTDRDRTVSRRSEPSAAYRLMGEQPNPWDRLQPQDAMSRHRGKAKPVDVNSWGDKPVLSPGSFYPLLSDGPSMRNHRITKSVFRPCSTNLAARLMPLHSMNDFQPF